MRCQYCCGQILAITMQTIVEQVPRNILLIPNAKYELAADDPYFKRLTAFDYLQPDEVLFNPAQLFIGTEAQRTGGYYSVSEPNSMFGFKIVADKPQVIAVTEGYIIELANVASPAALGTNAVQYLPPNTEPNNIPLCFNEAADNFDLNSNPESAPNFLNLPSIALMGFYQHDINSMLTAVETDAQVNALTIISRAYTVDSSTKNTVIPMILEVVIDSSITPVYFSYKINGVVQDTSTSAITKASDLLDNLGSQDNDNDPETYLTYFGICQFSTDYLLIGRRLSDAEIAQTWEYINDKYAV